MNLSLLASPISLGIVLWLFSSAIMAESEKDQHAAVVEACGAAYRDSSGKAHAFLLPQLSKSLAAEEKFVLPPDAPANVVSIQCGRESLVPLITDFKVLAAGYRFYVLSGDRTGVLEIEDGRVRFNMLSGVMNDIETEQIQVLLNDGQKMLLELEAGEQQSP